MTALPFCFVFRWLGSASAATKHISNAPKFGTEAPTTCDNGEVGMTPDAST
jgi:hypothetical protein